mgnify:CR=1 FL=1
MGTYEQLDEWRAAALADLVDCRLADRDWVDAWLWFWLHLYADLVEYEAEFAGVSFRQDDHSVLMVVKVLQEGVRQVVFVSSDTATHCVQKLRRRLREGSVRFVRDKYA